MPGEQTLPSPEALPKPLRVGGLLLGWASGYNVSLLVPPQ